MSQQIKALAVLFNFYCLGFSLTVTVCQGAANVIYVKGIFTWCPIGLIDVLKTKKTVKQWP